ncbi:hypothetical protein B7494_g3750 [Chlorociboria aeruginascens]|nr:hypothetical protein B7494_g3750 [Chlorociboria aeruginascens]
MQARDSHGRQVSLLNEEPSRQKPQLCITPYSESQQFDMVRSHSNNSERSPVTPSLLWSDSCDSQTTMDPNSPKTPSYVPDIGHNASHITLRSREDSGAHQQLQARASDCGDYNVISMGQAYCGSITSPTITLPYCARTGSYPEVHMFDDDEIANATAERGAKRYPCRFRESHNCDKTFTTSGHASRHSKIHTAEKGVNCQYDGCPKRFTRSDNMKQHLETHFKDRARASLSQKATPKSVLAMPTGVKRPQPANRLSPPELSPHEKPLSYEQYPVDRFPMVLYTATVEANKAKSPSRPMAAPENGALDVLAMAASLPF